MVALAVIIVGVIVVVVLRASSPKEQAPQDAIAAEVRNPANLPKKFRVKKPLDISLNLSAYEMYLNLSAQNDTTAMARMQIDGLLILIEPPATVVVEEYIKGAETVPQIV